MKIRTRLTIQFIFISASIFLLALLFIFNQFRQYVENEFYTHLESKGEMTAAMVLRHEDDLKPIEKQQSEHISKLPSVGNISIFNDQFQCIFTLNTSAQLVSPLLLKNIEINSPFRFKQEHFQAIGTIKYSVSGKKYIIVAEDVPDFSKLLTLRNILLLSFFLMIAAVAAGGWFYAGQALQPVSHIVNEVDNILPVDLSKRLKKDNNHDELSHLVTTFNSLLDRIEHAFQMQRGFISNVSHELKNPIAAMDAQLQMVRNKMRTPQEYDRVLASLHEDVKELADTGDKLLELAKIHSGNTQIPFSKVRLDELIYQSRDMLVKTHSDYRISIEIKRLPDDEDELCIYGNESLLRSAILNLLDNGCKFSEDRKVSVILDYNAAAQLQIKDNGGGISEKDLPFIFEPFFRGAHTGYKKGSGVGLFLVKSIMDLHNIGIHVQSMEGQGATFSLSFPPLKHESQFLPTLREVDMKLPFSKFKGVLKLFSLSIFMITGGCNFTDSPKHTPPQYQQAFNISQDWYSMILELVQYSDGYRPPVSARMYAYIGLAAWESSLPFLENAHSISPILKGVKIPTWNSKQLFIKEAALNQTYSTLVQYFFPHTPYDIQQKHINLFKKWEQTIYKQYPIEAIQASKSYAKAVADAVFEYSAQDSIGHQAYLYNYHPHYKPPIHEGAWQPNSYNAMPALLPYWGSVKTFITHPDDIKTNDPMPFSIEQNSAFFAQAMEVYITSKPMTKEKEWIAEFWSDDYPNISFCAASRWISIAHQALDNQNADIKIALETYLKLGLALNDVAVKVWSEKYHFSVQRPDTYIQKYIDPSWKPLHDTPPFPSYPSGHSAFGSAASIVLSEMLGQNISFTDRSHEDCTVFNGKPRFYENFKDMASENALSRLYMGVHYRMDCEEGIRLGNLIGTKTANLNFKKDKDLTNSSY